MGFLYNGSKKRLYFIQFLLIVAVTYLIYCFLPKERGAVLPNYEEKKPWSGTAVIADQSFPILRSEEDVRADSLSILEEFKPYYNLNENTADKVSADIAAAIEKSQKPELLALIDPLKRRLHALYSKGVISDDEKAKVTGGTEISVIETKGKTKTVLTTDINDLWVLSHLYNQLFMDEHIKQQQEALKALGIEEYLVPNLERDEEKCETELKDMFATIARYAGDVAKGEKIIDHGQIVDETSYLKLKSFEEKLKGEELIGKQVLTKRLGQALLVMLFLGLLTVYLNLFKEDYTVKLRHMLLFYTLLLIFPLMALLFQRYTPIDVYILPFAIVPIMTRVFFDSRTAFITHVTLLVICIIVLTYPFEFFTTQLVGGMVAIYSLKDMSSRAQLLKTAILVALAMAITYYIEQLMQTFRFVPTRREAQGYISFLFNGILSLVAYPLMTLVEKAFDFTSNVTLIELSNTNNSILRRLSEVAPGTFSHSINVGNLAAEIANRIDADSSLVRTGALYHDIGKVNNPVFFTENQTGVNPHDNITEKESASIIINHVLDGQKLAEQYNLPNVIKDFILTHHGLGTTKYFYIKYQNAHPDEVVDKAAFMYPGPNPFTREQAILMMTDSVEAASHSLKEYTEENISKMVNTIIDNQVQEGFFAESPITFRDITLAKQVLIEKLKAMYHTRIQYPKATTKPVEQEPAGETESGNKDNSDKSAEV